MIKIDSVHFNSVLQPVTHKPALERTSRLWCMACLVPLFPHSIPLAFALDLSLPKDDYSQAQFDRGAIAGDVIEAQSPAITLYVDNVRKTIMRRLGDGFPRDNAGRVICGEAAYTMQLGPDGSIVYLEVIPVQRHVDTSSEIESFIVQPTPGFRIARNAKRTLPVASEKSERDQFAQILTGLLRNMAPFPAHPYTGEGVGRSLIQSGRDLVHVGGNIGVECRKWEATP
jgi:hypothetical protein